MEHTHTLELAAVAHPNPKVRQVGFGLSHPYVEQCWGAVVGPSSVAITRRLPVLWTQQEPAHIPVDELARSLGLGAGAGRQGRLQRSLDRLVRFSLATWREPGRALDAYTEVPPLSGRQLDRLPAWSRRSHDRLLSDHLDQLATGHDHHRDTGRITSRLDRLERPTPPVPVLGR